MKLLLTVILACSLYSSFAYKTYETPEGGLPGKIFYKWNVFSMGADLSYVNQIEDCGGVYKDSSIIRDPFSIFASHGANTVRVRLWHTPIWTGRWTEGKLYSDLYDAEKTIRRAKQSGMAVNLDIHYSDEWADPQNQSIPEAWKGLNLTTMADSIYNYTLGVLNYLKSKNLVPEMVQVGNETNTGMLWPVGRVENENWAAFGSLLKSGIKAVRDFSATSSIKPLIILHVAQLQHADWWVNGVFNKAGVNDFDIIGLSHYAKWSSVASMTAIEQTIRNLLSTYSKQVMIVEVAYPWTTINTDSYANIIGAADSVAGYPLTTAGQYNYMKDLTQHVFNAGGTGVMYWEPAWITSPMHDKWGTGSAWENCAFFDFSGNSLPVLNFMTYPYKTK